MHRKRPVHFVKTWPVVKILALRMDRVLLEIFVFAFLSVHLVDACNFPTAGDYITRDVGGVKFKPKKEDTKVRRILALNHLN